MISIEFWATNSEFESYKQEIEQFGGMVPNKLGTRCQFRSVHNVLECNFTAIVTESLISYLRLKYDLEIQLLET
jgi:hypothetical protein